MKNKKIKHVTFGGEAGVQSFFFLPGVGVGLNFLKLKLKGGGWGGHFDTHSLMKTRSAFRFSENPKTNDIE